MPEKEGHNGVVEGRSLNDSGTAHQSAAARMRTAEIRSDDVQEILSHVPNWMIRWGITLIFGLIALLLLLAWIVRYPDVIPGAITLTTEVPPVKLVSQTSGQLHKIHRREGSRVHEGDVIAEIQNPLSEKAIDYLKATMAAIDRAFFADFPAEQFTPVPFNDSNHVFGEMQTEYNRLKSTVREYELLLTDKFRENTIRNLNRQVQYRRKLAAIGDRQLELSVKAVEHTQEKYQINKRLYEKGAISKMDFYTKEKEVTAHEQEIENLKKNSVQNDIAIAEYQKQLNELKYEFDEKERKLRETIALSRDNLNNFMHTWQQSYVIVAPFSGKVTYLSSLSVNQFIRSGTPLFAVIPENNQYIGHVTIPAKGFGKVRTQQKVHIKIDNYPHHQYGQLDGEVTEISPLPGADNAQKQLMYTVKVKLLNGLTTTYQKELDFKPEMSGTAEIITADMRLIERVFNQFKKIMDK